MEQERPVVKLTMAATEHENHFRVESDVESTHGEVPLECWMALCAGLLRYTVAQLQEELGCGLEEAIEEVIQRTLRRPRPPGSG